MPLKGQKGIIPDHSATIVGNLDEFSATRLNLNFDSVEPASRAFSSSSFTTRRDAPPPRQQQFCWRLLPTGRECDPCRQFNHKGQNLNMRSFQVLARPLAADCSFLAHVKQDRLTCPRK